MSSADRTGSRVAAVTACYIVPIPLEIIATSLRIYARQRQARAGLSRFAIDDFFILFATICAIGQCCVGLVYGSMSFPLAHLGSLLTFLGQGLPMASENISIRFPRTILKFRSGTKQHHRSQAILPYTANLYQYFQGNYIFSHFYNISLGMIKLSILTFYYRLFITPIFRKVVLATIAFIASWVLTITLVLALECRPIAKFWNPQIPGKCFDLVAFSYFTNISNLLTDVWIFLLPIPVIWRLHISYHQRLGLCGVFLIGLGTCIISSVRLSVVFAQGSTDFTWDGVPLGIMSVFEPLGGILSANLPITYVLFANSFRKMRETFSGHFGPRGRLSPSSNNRFGRGQDVEDRWIQLDQQGSSSADSKPMLPGEPRADGGVM